MKRSSVVHVVTMVLSVVLLGMVQSAGAQKPVSQAAAVSRTFVINAIDHSSRLVTLRDTDGSTATIYCGPEVKRFDALKVGDKVTFRYHESMVYQINKPGAAPTAATAGVTRTPGDRPGGTVAQQVTTVVTVNAVDPKTPSVSVTGADGRKMSFKVDNPKNLEGVKAGDKVEITYTQAFAVSVEPAK
jgi:Cu/Ag efflux protein CusF